ncbi:class I SAM-dependent methyltransferase [Wenzhouxiangella limi]|uniref:Class I SAM-dependent methyltransferase n=1 Tax=Wenzhouxiangella limi TaxID=2707351 RepID=A0A845UYM5_9GAMM|nr:class I SAM-dependent methyltransferase [Wenzhouxiangella limi]NDY94980.1 class I SAM-dependent methyltransferase [Wenzhouxiangella limi]
MIESPSLEFTGERFTPECVREMAYEHWHRYAFAAALVTDKLVLDAACGEGYGSHLLSAKARQVTGIDIDPATVKHARSRYGADRLSFECASCLDLPLADDSVDVVVSFETLEHLAEHDELMAEFRRVLRPEGFVLISSPDRKTYSDETGYDNPFHVRELYRDQFEQLLGAHFPAVRLMGQKLLFVSALWSMDGQGAAQWLSDRPEASTVAPDWPPLYYIAAAAATRAALPELPAVSLYGDRAESVYQHYNDEVRKHIRAGEVLAEREAEIASLKATLAKPWWRRWFGR